MAAETRVYRSTTNLVIAVAGWAAAALAAAGSLALAAGGRPRYALALVPLALVALLLWELFWRPRLRVSDDGVEIVDVFHTSRVPWTVVIDVQTRWALTIVTPRRRYRASAAPAPGVRGRPRFGRESQHPGVGRDGGIELSAALGTDSGDAAAIVRERWHRLSEAGLIDLGRADTDRARTRPHTVALVAALVLLAATVVALITA